MQTIVVITLVLVVAGILVAAVLSVRSSLRIANEFTIDQLRSMSPTEFEEWVSSRYEPSGYRAVHAGRTGDHGIAKSLTGIVVAEAKRFSGAVGEPVVRNLRGSMIPHGADHAYLVTTATVTTAAQTSARHQPITLIEKQAWWVGIPRRSMAPSRGWRLSCPLRSTSQDWCGKL